MTYQPRGKVYSTKTDCDKYRDTPFDLLACVGPRGEIWLVPGEIAVAHRSLRFRPGHKYAGLYSDDWRVQ